MKRRLGVAITAVDILGSTVGQLVDYIVKHFNKEIVNMALYQQLCDGKIFTLTNLHSYLCIHLLLYMRCQYFYICKIALRYV